MRNRILLIAILLITITMYSQNVDSLAIEKLKVRLEKTEGFQVNVKDALDIKFDKQQKVIKDDFDSLKKDYNLIKNLLFLGIPIFGLISILGLWWKGVTYINSQLTAKFDNIINKNEQTILDIINNQDEEKQILNNKKILILTSKDGDDIFLRNFFRGVGFPVNNVKFVKIDSFEKSHLNNRDLIFANNESDDLSFDLIDEYFLNSNSKSVLFYFNTTRNNYIKNEVADRLSFANTKTQIYGNIINLLKYQKVI